MTEIDEKEVEAVAMLLEKWYGFHEAGLLGAFQTDAWNRIGGDADSDHHGFLVHTYDPDPNNNLAMPDKEWAFKTSTEAARFYIKKRKEMGLDK